MDHATQSIEPEMSAAELTIEIDSDTETDTEEVDDQKTNLERFKAMLKVSVVPKIGKPRKISHRKLLLDDSMKCSDLSESARECLTGHLNLPSLGTLRNWESVGASMGMHNDTILNLRIQSKPTEHLLKKFAQEPINRLVVAIAKAGRMDTLYSLLELKITGRLIGPRAVPYAIPRAFNALDYLVSSDSAVYAESEVSSNYILVTHYETTPDEKKQFRWLMKNLKVEAEKSPIMKPIIDIHKKVSDENIWESIQQVFSGAAHIVVSYSPSYLSVANVDAGGDTKISTVQHLASLMNTEYCKQKQKNTRFRPVTFEELPAVEVPVGWASSTVIYSFPSHAPDLFKRLFSTNTDNTVTL